MARTSPPMGHRPRLAREALRSSWAARAGSES